MNRVQVLVIKHRHGQLNPAKIARGVHVIQAVGGAQHSRFGHAHVRAKQSAEHGFVANVGVATRDFGDCTLSDFIRRQDAKLNSNDF